MRRLWMLVGLVACGGGGGAPDGPPGPDAYMPDDAAHLPDGAPLTWVDFSAAGCTLAQAPAAADADAPVVTCSGAAALTVTFTSLASGPIDTWAWTFGDGDVSSLPTPAHRYVLPGAYDVTLAAAGPGGSATITRAGFVVVAPAGLGAACSAAAQCGSGSCACGDAGCDAAVSLCAGPCGAACAGVCGQLGGGWDAPLCLQPCSSDDQCEAGRTCTAVASGASWALACVPAGTLAAVGASCATATGLDGGACASGDCLGIGVRGACTFGCAGGAACPAGSACASFGNGTSACMATCDSAHACGDDPWLACEGAGAAGPWGFTLPAGGTVCAPRSCSGPADCAGGACVAGHCAAS